MINRCLLVALLGFYFHTANAQRGYPHVFNYLPGEYQALPVNWYIAQGSRGMMFFANRGNLLQYDGNSWRKIAIQPYSPVRSVIVADDGTVYVGTTDDFGYLKPDSLSVYKYHSFKPYLDSLAFPAASVWKILELGNKIYFQTKSRLYQWDGKHFKIWETDGGFHRAFVANNELWVKDNTRGLLRLNKDSLEPIAGGDVFVKDLIYIITSFNDESILIFTRSRGTYRYNHRTQQLQKFETSADSYLKENKGYHGIKLSNDNFALATLQGGVVLLNKETTEHFVITKQEGLPSNDIKNVYQGNDGSLWCASANGISVVKINEPVWCWGQHTGIKGTVHAAIRNPKDSLLYLATSAGVCFLKGKKAQYISGINDQAWDMAVYDNQLLVSSLSGIYAIEEGKAQLIVSMTVPFKMNKSTKHDMVFVGSLKGLYAIRKRAAKWELLSFDQIVNDRVLDLREDYSGNLWVSTGKSGIYKLRIEKEKVIDSKHFSVNSGYEFDREVNIFEHGKNILFNANKVLYKAMPDDTFVLHAEFGREYVHGDSGIFHLNKDSYNNTWIYGASTDYNYWVEMIPRSIKEQEQSKVRQPFRYIPPMAVFHIYHEKEVTWLAGSEGLFQYFHNQYSKYDISKVIIRTAENSKTGQMFYGGDGRDTFKVKIDYNNPVTIGYVLPVYGKLHSVYYRYRLKGSAPNWSSWSTDTKAAFSHLSPGKYTFEVQSNLGNAPSVFTFYIIRPWYLSYWAYTLYFLLALAIIWGISHLYAMRLRHQNEKLESIIGRRTAELLVQKQKVEEQNERIEQQKVAIEEKNEKLQINNRILRKLNKEKNYLMGAVAHDLKNPLNTIYGLAELLNFTSESFSNKQVEYLSNIKSIAYELTERINKILNISAIEANSVIMNLKRENLFPLIEEVVKNFERQAGLKSISINLEAEERSFISIIDKSYFKQIMENLISNALKYSFKNTTINIRVGVTDQDKVRIEVEDYGPGIPQDEMSQLFQPFKKGPTVPSDGERATGMGLSIVKRYVKALDGKVWCESVVEKGSKFIIELDDVLYE